MFDTRIRKVIDPALDTIGRGLAARGVGANTVTVAGFILGIVAALFIVQQAYLSGLVFVLASRLCDGLDGAVARATQKTDLGGFLDIVLDFAFYGLIPMAFILADPSANAIAGGLLLLSFYVNGATFLTYALMAEKRGISEAARGKKSLLYTTGLAEGTETIVVFVLFCLFPGYFVPIALIFAAIVMITLVARILLAVNQFRDST